jgi:hypothetical protein
VWSLDPIPAGASGKLEVRTDVLPTLSEGALLQSVAVLSAGPSRADAQAVTRVGESALAVSINATPSRAAIGEVQRYTLMARNRGQTPLRGVLAGVQVEQLASLLSIGEPMPAAVHLLPNPTGFPLLEIPDLPPGGTARVTFESLVHPRASAGTLIEAVAWGSTEAGRTATDQHLSVAVEMPPSEGQ